MSASRTLYESARRGGKTEILRKTIQFEVLRLQIEAACRATIESIRSNAVSTKTPEQYCGACKHFDRSGPRPSDSDIHPQQIGQRGIRRCLFAGDRMPTFIGPFDGGKCVEFDPLRRASP